MTRFLILSLLLPVFFLSAVAQDRPIDAEVNLRRQMPAELFKAAGLDKLSPDELKALEGWLNGYVEEEAEQLAEEVVEERVEKEVEERVDEAVEVALEERKKVIKEETTKAFGFLSIWDKSENVPEELKGPEFIESSIAGKFRGWDGGTTFSLENGQVWEQQGRDRYYMPMDNPKVRIEKGALGSHYLRIIDTGRRVKVARVE